VLFLWAITQDNTSATQSLLTAALITRGQADHAQNRQYGPCMHITEIVNEAGRVQLSGVPFFNMYC
jgi:hypothetical protein